MRTITRAFVHCAATYPHQDIGVKEIRVWHTRPKAYGGRGWSDIGYHYVIRRDGTVEEGRPLEIAGAHAYGHNKDSIGICLVGGLDRAGDPSPWHYTAEQWLALEKLLAQQEARFPGLTVWGHNQVAKKACPCFDVPHWYRTGNVKAVR